MSDLEADKSLSEPPRAEMPPEMLEERLASTLLLAGEAIVPNSQPETVEFATPVDDRDAPIIEDFDWLNDLIAQFRHKLTEDSKRAELLRLLPQGFGNGEILQVLFCNLFPEQRKRRKLYRDRNGKKILTQTQVEILCDTAIGMTPAQIAQKRGCSRTNVTNILESVEQRLQTSSPPESVAVAMSMGYLPLDVMDYIRAISRTSPRDYWVLDTQVARMAGIEESSDPVFWQALAAFGLLLMLVTGRVVARERAEASRFPANGVLYRLERQADGTYQTHVVAGPGLLRRPMGLAVAPPKAAREGFTPGSVFVSHDRAAITGINLGEVVEFSQEGKPVRAFCGGRTLKTHLTNSGGLTFTPSGALLVTTGEALLRFTTGGHSVKRFLNGCFTDVCADYGSLIAAAHYSSRGGSLRIYSRHGKLVHEFAQQPPGFYFSGLQVAEDGEIMALRVGEGKAMMEVYGAQGEHRRCWQIPNAVEGRFALDRPQRRLYVPCKGEVAVYTLDGTLEAHIPPVGNVRPKAVTLGSDDSIWLLGTASEAGH